MNTIVNSIIKNSLRNANATSSGKAAAAASVAAAAVGNSTSTDSGLSQLNSGTLATGIAVGVLTLVLIVFFIAVIIHYRMIRKLPEPVYETGDEKSARPTRSASLASRSANPAYVNNLYLAPTKNYNPKLERINEDVSSISNSIDSNLKSAGVRHPGALSSRRASVEPAPGPTLLVNTNADAGFQEPVRSESGVVLTVRRLESGPDQFYEDEYGVRVSKASL